MQSATLDRNPCVLLVETDEAFAERLSLDLKEAGYSTVIAHDAISGWHQAWELQPNGRYIQRHPADGTQEQCAQKILMEMAAEPVKNTDFTSKS